ncbi:MAG: molecular chaperone HtpG [Spirochaetae bacterium HGW-Spirochaetae-7]|jgi:molecular chaperone HtpG|nr:MAG: molecular chaperone HtpG [Spirochaetae bacterium HGW-Spirochaetae-7]
MAVHQFQAEVNQLLQLIIHSLYSHREIFLRELVSNASDAIDKLKYLTLSDDAYKAIAFEPAISISFDAAAGTLSIADNGVGMDEADLVENLGTIARSGTRRFIEAMEADKRKDSNLIGRFGVGFYASYMVADEVTVTTRKAGQDTAWVWKSDGKGSYDIEPGARESHGTTVVLKANDDGREFLSRWRLEELVKKYSNHVAFPIRLAYDEDEYDEKGKKKGSKIHKDEQINSAQALWRRPKAELKDEDYVEFFKNISDSDEAPLFWTHTKAEGTIEYTTLFYIPSKAPFDLYHADYKPGVKLYVRRVFITDDDKELLPVYLRFIRGVIDSEDLPLNVSRELLQQNRVMNSIRTASVKKVLSELKDLSTADKDKYASFIAEFNRPLKEGLYGDFANREALLELVRFKSSSVDGWTSFADYKSRMKDDQKAIWYLTGDAEERLRKSPLLEMYRKQGVEVLICPDEIDELVMPMVGRFGDIELKAINRAGAEKELEGKPDEKKAKDLAPAIERIKKALGDEVKDVRLSSRLTDSPSCIVVDGDDPSLQLQQFMKSMGRADGIEVKPILEVNGDHPLFARLSASDDETLAADVSRVLLDQALLVEGAPIKDPADFVTRMNRLIG